jgi:protein TonB
MPTHVDILEQQESIFTPVVASLLAHVAFFSAIALYVTIGNRGRVFWGTPHSLGGASVGVQAVSQIPLPARTGQSNPLANDTESRVPMAPKAQAKPAPKPPEPDAIAIKGRQRKEAPRPRQPERLSSDMFKPRPGANQLYSSSGQALASNMYGAQTGTGGVGIGPRSAFGYKYGWYRDLLEQRIAQKWRTGDLDPRIQSAPPAIVTFDILRNGSVRDVRVLQSSGNRTLDYSAQRAVYDAAPFPALPNDFDRSTAQIEIWFQLKR